MTNKQEISLIRSSAAEYLTFVAASGQGGGEAVYADESIWLTQKMEVRARMTQYLKELGVGT